MNTSNKQAFPRAKPQAYGPIHKHKPARNRTSLIFFLALLAFWAIVIGFFAAQMVHINKLTADVRAAREQVAVLQQERDALPDTY